MISYKEVNAPTWLTIIRLVVSPLLLPLLFVTFLPDGNINTNIALALLFAMIGATDFFDGYLARKFCQETLFGKVLDPIADKFLVYSTLIALLAIGKLYYYWVVLLIGREFFVMGLRLIALEYGMNVSVSWGGKIKTAVQMALLIYLIINPYQYLGFTDIGIWWNGIELFLLIITLILSVVSAYWYYISLINQIKNS